MKKTTSELNKIGIILLLLCISLASCQKLEQFKYFTVKQSMEFKIPPTGIPGVVDLPIVPVENNVKYQLEQQGALLKNVEEIRLDKMTLELKEPTDKNFNFLRSIRIYINAAGLEEKMIAYHENVPADTRHFELKGTGQILDAYLNAGNFNIRVSTTIDKLVSYESTVKSDMYFKAKVKI